MAKNAIEIERGRFYWLKDKFKEEDEEDGKKKPMSIEFPEEEDEEDLDLDYGDHRKTTMD